MALELEDSQPFLNTLEPSHDSATCRANLEVAIENDSAAEVVKLSNYLLAETTSSSENEFFVQAHEARAHQHVRAADVGTEASARQPHLAFGFPHWHV